MCVSIVYVRQNNWPSLLSASGREQTFCLQKAARNGACEFVYGRKYLRATLAVNLSRKSSPPLLIIHSRVIDPCNMNAAGVD